MNTDSTDTRPVEECASIFAWVAAAAAAVSGTLVGADVVSRVAQEARTSPDATVQFCEPTFDPDPYSLSIAYLAQYDADGDGELSLDELNQALKKEGINIQLTENAFKYFDTDGDGELNENELQNSLDGQFGRDLVVRIRNNQPTLDTRSYDELVHYKYDIQRQPWDTRKLSTYDHRREEFFLEAERRERRERRAREKKAESWDAEDVAKVYLAGSAAVAAAGAWQDYRRRQAFNDPARVRALWAQWPAAIEEGLQEAFRMSEASDEKTFYKNPFGKIKPMDTTECLICSVPLLEAEGGWIVRRCGHYFCTRCASEWGRRGHKTCPYCMKEGVDFNPQDGRKIYQLFPTLRF